MSKTFRALVVRKSEDKQFSRAIEERNLEDLPDGDVVVRVRYSSVNFKDGLSANGNPGVSRNFPHTPGVDAAGIVESSSVDHIQPGEEVIVIGFDLGMNTAGGFGQTIRVPAGWVVKKPAALSLKETMILGTAGFTAAQSVDALRRQGVKPMDGPVAVSGATGGVGSVAVALLSHLGFEVTAATGKADQHDFLTDLGAANVVDRGEIDDDSGRPLLRPTWAGAIDTVGGNTLATLIKSTRYGGAVTCCGMVAGTDFTSSVFPFILRGVSLLGIDSVESSLTEKNRIWQLLAGEFKLDNLEAIAREVSLDEVSDELDRILQGQQRGRVVVNVG